MNNLKYLLVATLTFSAIATQASEFEKQIPMKDRGASTYYINGNIKGIGDTEFMVDTGSGYVTINEDSLDVLKQNGQATYVRDLTGIMADGRRRVVPVYRIASITLGTDCSIHDVEAAVFPGKTRYILGLSALQKTSPFIFSMNPPQLTLSNCAKPIVAAEAE